jgi:hypothetical protein
MPKPKVVKTPRHSEIPSSPANRELTTFEKATSWVDSEGMISADEGAKRVFLAAADNGGFSVVWNVHRGGRERRDVRSYPEALYMLLNILIQDFAVPEALQRSPAIYAFTSNRDTMISAVGYKDKETKEFVAQCDALADVLQEYLDLWCKHLGIRQNGPSPKIDQLRTPRRKVRRERLPIKRERL